MKHNRIAAAILGLLTIGSVVSIAAKAQAWGNALHASVCYNANSTNELRPQGGVTGHDGIRANSIGPMTMICPVPNETGKLPYGAFLADVQGVADEVAGIRVKACSSAFSSGNCGPTRSSTAAGSVRVALGSAASGGSGDTTTQWVAATAGSVWAANPYFHVTLQPGNYVTNLTICSTNNC